MQWDNYRGYVEFCEHNEIELGPWKIATFTRTDGLWRDEEGDLVSETFIKDTFKEKDHEKIFTAGLARCFVRIPVQLVKRLDQAGVARVRARHEQAKSA